MTGSLWELAAALVVFLVSHSLPAFPGVRAQLVQRMGERVYLSTYSLLSVAVVAWLIAAALAAPYIELWPYAAWTAAIPGLAMPVACVLIVSGLVTPNPLSVSLMPERIALHRYDPARPGLLALTRHPVLWGFNLWAAAHLFPNGDLSAVIVFGAFLVFGLVGPAIIDHRRRRHLGEASWQRLAGPTSAWPFAALLAGRTRFIPADLPARGLLGGFALYAALLVLHPWLFRVPAIPGWWFGW